MSDNKYCMYNEYNVCEKCNECDLQARLKSTEGKLLRAIDTIEYVANTCTAIQNAKIECQMRLKQITKEAQ